MKQALQLKLSQHLTLTPQLQQSIRLLQLSTIELNQEIEQMLADNPLLERSDEFAPADAAAFGGDEKVQTESIADAFAGGADAGADGDWGEREAALAPRTTRSDDDEDAPGRQHAAAGVTLREHLLQQIGLMRLSDRDRGLLTAIVEALDDDGYLTIGLDEIADMLPGELEIDLGDLETALKLLQSCEPAGVGARSLAEALTLQLRGRQGAAAALARTIVTEHLDALAARDFTLIKRACKCSESDLKAARELILSLNPRPGALFDTADTRYITPDVIVRKSKTGWRVAINPDAVPRLRINRMYADILSRERGRGAASGGDGTGLASRLQEAKWLLKNVQQRFETIERVAQAIVDRQRHFFDHGEVAMRPLVLREIADELGLHESTISRVTTNKYMLTPRGLFELKFFFGSHVATDSGGACSSTAIRALIKQLVSAEDLKRPLSDSKIVDILGQQGIVVARRTIAKYRDALKIPPANLRKSL
ncbi:MAG: RNA polymerase factor sigma-54 [Burkholderiales bacterium]|nr:RNA polymerase factor sigma-54 [Burkholderiales bacterium]